LFQVVSSLGEIADEPKGKEPSSEGTRAAPCGAVWPLPSYFWPRGTHEPKPSLTPLPPGPLTTFCYAFTAEHTLRPFKPIQNLVPAKIPDKKTLRSRPNFAKELL
jgi:hypothetical protein